MDAHATSMMELQAEEEQWRAYALSQQDEPGRPLQCQVDGDLDYIFDWKRWL